MLSGALKIADKVTVAMEAVGNKIRLDFQECEDARIIGDRQVLMVVAYEGRFRATAIFALAMSGHV